MARFRERVIFVWNYSSCSFSGHRSLIDDEVFESVYLAFILTLTVVMATNKQTKWRRIGGGIQK
jgi:hypothetical protein